MKKAIELLILGTSLTVILSLSTHCLAYNYENTGLSARVMGLSYSFTGIANDPTTLYWNPGGIAQASGASFTFANPYNIPDYTVTNLSISKPLDFKNSFGFNLGVGLLYSSDIGTVTNGSITTRSGESRLGLGFGLAKGEISFGGTSWISQLIDGDVKDVERSIDLGLLWQPGNVKVGTTVRNLRASAPLETTLGVSYLVTVKRVSFVQSLVLALDMTNCNYDGKSDFCWNVGIEVAVSSGFVIRLGSNALNPLSSLGLGFAKGSWLFDYAVKLHELGNTHYLSIGCKL